MQVLSDTLAENHRTTLSLRVNLIGSLASRLGYMAQTDGTLLSKRSWEEYSNLSPVLIFKPLNAPFFPGGWEGM